MKKFKKGDVITLRPDVTDRELVMYGILNRSNVEKLTVVETDSKDNRLNVYGDNGGDVCSKYWVSSEWYDKSND